MLARSAPAEATAIGDSFARKVAVSRKIWTVSGIEGLARLPSNHRPGREMTLCWSSSEAAERWALRTARHPRVNPIMLGNFTAEVLPKLRALNRLLSPDWSDEPFHPELEPGQLELRLRAECIDLFAETVVKRRSLFVLENEVGFAYTASAAGSSKQALAAWTSSDDASHNIRGFWAEMEVVEIPVVTFVDKTLASVGAMGRSVSLDHGLGGMVLELNPPDLMTRLRQAAGANRRTT